jgi:hypothetical protein
MEFPDFDSSQINVCVENTLGIVMQSLKFFDDIVEPPDRRRLSLCH